MVIARNAIELHHEMYERRRRKFAQSHGLDLLQFQNVNRKTTGSVKVGIEKRASKEKTPQSTT